MAVPERGLEGLSNVDRRELEDWLVEFDPRWAEGALPDAARRLPLASPWRLLGLRAMVKIDLKRQ